MYAVVIFVLSVVIAAKICKIINRNTIGTTGAYIIRGFVVWVIVFFALLYIWAKLTGQGV